MNPDDESMEPLDEVEQAMLDRLRMIEGPQGCHWVDDVGQYCNKSLAQLPSRLTAQGTWHQRLASQCAGPSYSNRTNNLPSNQLG